MNTKINADAAAVRTARALHAPILDVLDATCAALVCQSAAQHDLHPAAAAAYITAGKAFDDASGGYSQGVRQ